MQPSPRIKRPVRRRSLSDAVFDARRGNGRNPSGRSVAARAEHDLCFHRRRRWRRTDRSHAWKERRVLWIDWWGWGFGGGTVFQLWPPAVAGGAWTETVLYSFTGQNGTGAGPVAAPALGPLERLFGTAFSGGASGWGIAFELTPPPPACGAWTESVLYNLPAVVDGTQVSAGLVIGPNGALYGTTWDGGTYDRGTAYELAPSGGGTETTLYSFGGLAGDGSGRAASMVVGPNGALYGTTAEGGARGYRGVTFRPIPPMLLRAEFRDYLATLPSQEIVPAPHNTARGILSNSLPCSALATHSDRADQPPERAGILSVLRF
jgi:uncharacterized repeat protein (TIGR03803 family)